jgi:GNAT superfamily N-acetyltransferase
VVAPAGPADAPELARVEEMAWPPGQAMRADEGKFACRIRLGGVLAARRSGRLIGFLSTFRPRWADAGALERILARCPEDVLDLPASARWEEMQRLFGLPASWHVATAEGTLEDGRLHRPGGQVVFGVGIATDPLERGKNVARALLAAALCRAAESGARYFLAYSRLPQYRSFPMLSLDEYLAVPATRGGRVGPHDFGFRLHWSVGAQPARTASGGARYVGIPTTMRDDVESRGCGALVVTPLGDRAPYPFERLRT